MASEWLGVLRTWASTYRVAPAETLDVTLEQLKARMLRTLRMPEDDMEARWYRFVVCSLERVEVPTELPGTWSWAGKTSVGHACYYAASGDVDDDFEQFLRHCHNAFTKQYWQCSGEDAAVWLLRAVTEDPP